MLVGDSRSRLGELDSLWGFVTQPEEAIEDGNSVLPAALCQTPQTCPLVHPHPTHLQSGTTSHLQLRGCCPAPQPGTQPTPPTQFIKLLLQFILQMPPEPSFRTLPGGITTVLKCNSPLQNGQNLSNRGHGTSFGPSRGFHPRHPWAQTRFQLHQSHLCSAGNISKTTAHQGFILALPSAENSLSRLPTPMMRFGPKYPHLWLAPFP